MTPGNSVGHVSLWRESDRVLIAGDAVITPRQDSALAVAAQTPEMHGPPAYLTVNWEAAEVSVQTLSALEPEMLVPGHGPPMQGEEMRAALRRLAADFTSLAVLDAGRYIGEPARIEDGGAYR